MAENTDEEHLDSPTNKEAENPSEEIIPAKDTETVATNQETENMEVHHHSHASHGKKNWKSYFWEFLMLFLAVFCGFLAENQREHYVERQREKQFMQTLVEDIHEDSSNLQSVIDGFALINRQIDSIIPLLKDDINIERNAKQIYQHAVWLHAYYKITYSDRTIVQLKNSGNFRLIQSKIVSGKILEYDGIMRNNIENMQNEYVYQNKEKMLDLSNGFLKTSVIKKWLAGGWKYHDIELLSVPYFLTIDKAKIDRFTNQLDQYSLAITWFIKSLKTAIMKAEELESLIKKEYHLD